MKIKLRRKKAAVVICWLLVVACMIFIFSMSAEPASESSRSSGRIIRFVLRIFVPDFDHMDADDQLLLVEKWQFAVRKGAHFSIYALLGALFVQAFLGHTDKPRFIIPASWVCTVLYAGTDELHQRLVSGRSGEFRDVALDGAGALLGVLVSYGLTRLIAKRSAKRSGRAPE